MLCKYYSPVHTATTAHIIVSQYHSLTTYSTYFPPTVENFPIYSVWWENRFVHEYRHLFPLMNEIYSPRLMCEAENIKVVACMLRKPSRVAHPSPFRLLPSEFISLRGSRGSETDHFLNHSWALPRKERHAESWGTAMRNVSLFLSYAMIYDTMLVTDLIITVYFPSEGEKVIVSDFAFFPPLHSSSFVSQMNFF